MNKKLKTTLLILIIILALFVISIYFYHWAYWNGYEDGAVKATDLIIKSCQQSGYTQNECMNLLDIVYKN